MVDALTHIDWDQRALSLWFTEIDAILLPELASEVADVARSIAPVRTRRTAVPPWAKRGYAGTGGRLKASVQWDVGRDYIGDYADVAALWYGRFLDPKARQLHRLHPFLPSALEWTLDGRSYYL